jgi:hypothetical protein
MFEIALITLHALLLTLHQGLQTLAQQIDHRYSLWPNSLWQFFFNQMVMCSTLKGENFYNLIFKACDSFYNSHSFTTITF